MGYNTRQIYLTVGSMMWWWKMSTSTPSCLVIESAYTARRMLQFIKPAALWLLITAETTGMGKIKCLQCCWVWISLTECFFTVIRQIVFYSSAFICHCLWKEDSLHPLSIYKSDISLEGTGKIYGSSVRHRHALLDRNMLVISCRSQKIQSENRGKKITY